MDPVWTGAGADVWLQESSPATPGSPATTGEQCATACPLAALAHQARRAAAEGLEQQEYPDWASMPPDLLRRIFTRPAASTSGSLAAARDTAALWKPWYRQLVTASAVCKSLRSALLGQDAGELWQTAVLRSPYAAPDTQPQQERHSATTLTKRLGLKEVGAAASCREQAKGGASSRGGRETRSSGAHEAHGKAGTPCAAPYPPWG